ncbi:hypothetical protein QTQ03_19920 [Micromonospora sp. WMMA1363]|nr:hypothetical protein [Micromonospora sp. WMMA1363]MDM4721748.1 hypothetical protein [Micromonospora sp. WMMA1363]
MANYGPPDDTAGEPWRNRRPEEAYRPVERGWRGDEAGYPPDPNPGTYPAGYVSPPRYDNPHRHGPPDYGTQRHGPEPHRPAYQPWDTTGNPEGTGGYPPGPAGYVGAPVPPSPPPRGRRPLIAALATALLLVVGGGVTLVYRLGQADAPPPAASPTAAAAQASTPADEASPVPSVAAAPESSADPRFVEVGECVRNDGPAGDKPKLLISECAPRTYEVLRRVDGPTTGEKDAAAKCAKVDGYTNWYFFDSELDTLDFVLCLKQR